MERECKRLATDGSNMMHTRWAYSMAGEEYARIHSWGHDPKRKVSDGREANALKNLTDLIRANTRLQVPATLLTSPRPSSSPFWSDTLRSTVLLAGSIQPSLSSNRTQQALHLHFGTIFPIFNTKSAQNTYLGQTEPAVRSSGN